MGSLAAPCSRGTLRSIMRKLSNIADSSVFSTNRSCMESYGRSYAGSLDWAERYQRLTAIGRGFPISGELGLHYRLQFCRKLVKWHQPSHRFYASLQPLR